MTAVQLALCDAAWPDPVARAVARIELQQLAEPANPNYKPRQHTRRRVLHCPTRQQGLPVTYHWTDTDRHELTTTPDTDLDGQPVVTFRGRRGNTTIPVRIPVDRIEELIAGIRETARQAAGAKP